VSSTSDLRETLSGLRRLLDAVEHPHTRDGLTLIERIRESFQGWPSGTSFDTTGGHRHEPVPMPLLTNPTHQIDHVCTIPRHDPTGEAAIRDDQAAADLNRFNKEARNTLRAITVMLDIAARYTPRPPNSIEVLEGTPEAGCASCARVTSPGTVGLAKTHQSPWWNPVDRNVTLSDGRKVGLCSWCRKDSPHSAAATGDMPPVAAVEAHRDGRRLGRTA